MKRLIQRLVWSGWNFLLMGDSTRFRPSDDGSLFNLEDDEIELIAIARLKIARGFD